MSKTSIDKPYNNFAKSWIKKTWFEQPFERPKTTKGIVKKLSLGNERKPSEKLELALDL